MRLPQHESFALQRERFALRFTCEHCALFDPDQEQCSHGYPTDEHRLDYYSSRTAPIVLCKDFELT